MKYAHILMAFSLILASCAPNRNLVYFNSLKKTGEYSTKITNRSVPTIQIDDLLSITVSSLNPESNLLFNNGVMPISGNTSTNSNAANIPYSPISPRTNEGYLVDSNGNVNFPILGPTKLAGLTKEEAIAKITDEIKKHIKNPIINIRFLNFKVTVVGEVNRPSTFSIPTERINIIEALGLAGDMTPFGKRENVLIIRETNGVRNAIRVDITDKDVLNSPYYYLQQNDIVYVEPIKVKSLQGSASTFYIPLITAAVSVLSLIIVSFR